MRNLRNILTIAVIVTCMQSGPRAVAAPLTIAQLLDIRHPSEPIWSPDGRHVAFLWDRCDVVNLYVVDARAPGTPLALTRLTDGKVSDAFWSADGNLVYFVAGGKLQSVAATGGVATEVWVLPEGANEVTPSPDRGSMAAAIRNADGGHDLIVRSLVDGKIRVVSSNKGLIYGIRWSPDGQHLAFVGDAKVIPHDVSPTYSGDKLVFRNPEFVPGQLYVVPTAGGKAKALGNGGSDYESIEWAGNGHLAYERVSSDFRDRSIVIADVEEGRERIVHKDHDAQFWSLPEYEAGGYPLPSPDGKWIAYVSDAEEDWDHLYIIATDGGEPVRLTSGHAEAWRPAWSHDGRFLAFDINEPDHPGDRKIGVVSVGATGNPAVRDVASREGTNTQPLWSPDDSEILFQRTDWMNSADLYEVAASGANQEIRLTDSMPVTMDKSLFVQPKYVTFPGADGTPVPGWLFVPRNLDRQKKHAAIVWIHGDGINQNYDGWHIQRNYAVYYSFHQYLLQQGYVVFAPDYRGSIGYGGKWRSAVYMDVGGKDAEDASKAGDYLKTLPYVDGNRIGVWGLSYGGFFTLIGLTRHPLLFRSGVDVAGVVDYAMYYEDPYHGDWTASRIGTPEQNPGVYANASPLSHVDALQRPLLILHGTADVNVPFIESVRLVDELLRQKKGDLVTFMMYPGEFHYFSREQVLGDAWRRVDEFFARTLNPSE